ncbi:MAG: hypothetical protein FWF08_06875 [Oscillospiraceae bacterium]|nr:hypothetical protein [Oscillospiraceae bacterium]
MNFSDVTGDWGEQNLDFVEAAMSGEELLRQVRAWREKLGPKRGVLDNYLAGVLKALTDTTNTFDAGQEGFEEALRPLRGILRQIKEGKEEDARQHPFYPQVRAYMDAHPFPHDDLYYSTYCAGLFGEYLTFAVQDYRQRCNDNFQAELAENGVPELYEALLSSGADITAESVDYLHNLIARVFVWIAPSTVFMQGMADQIVLALIQRDAESDRAVFQRLLDGEVIL